jgi:MFS family permease
MPSARPGLTFTLCVLLAINTMNFFDRQVPGAVAEPLRKELNLSDAQVGWLTPAFLLLYAVIGIPLGLWADIGRRTRILAVGVALWSVLTAVSGMAWNFWSLFLMRLGVGVGEASCAPTANSLLGDLFPRQRRAWAISVFMLGLPIGLGLSFIISGNVADWWGWRAAFLIAAVPGLVLALLCLWIPEPPRGAAEEHALGAARRPGKPLLLVLRIPTMWWIILSGALHNFNMYAIGTFLSPYLQRYHGLSTGQAGWISGVVYGCFGGMGILLGGWMCDRMVRRRVSGRLEVSTLALVVGTPCIFLALEQPAGAIWAFAAWMLPGCMLAYVYYSGVYSTIQDIVEPSLRGTAMAVYFFAMYLLGGFAGPVITGAISDHFARQAAAEEAPVVALQTIVSPIPQASFPANLPYAALLAANPKICPTPSEPARAIGLHHAMYVIPALWLGLIVVLFIASRTVTRDYEKLQKWISAGSVRDAGPLPEKVKSPS